MLSVGQWGLDGTAPHAGVSGCHSLYPQVTLYRVPTDVHGAMTQIRNMIRINGKSPRPKGAAANGAGRGFALRDLPTACPPAT